METMVLCMFAATALAVSVYFLCCKKPVWCFAGSIAVMVLTCLTGYRWKIMLINSGKDTALLGFHRYPAVPVILGILLAAACILLIVSIALKCKKQ